MSITKLQYLEFMLNKRTLIYTFIHTFGINYPKVTFLPCTFIKLLWTYGKLTCVHYTFMILSSILLCRSDSMFWSVVIVNVIFTLTPFWIIIRHNGYLNTTDFQVTHGVKYMPLSTLGNMIIRLLKMFQLLVLKTKEYAELTQQIWVRIIFFQDIEFQPLSVAK